MLSWHHVSEAISSSLHPVEAAALLPGGHAAEQLAGLHLRGLLEAAGLPPRAWSTFDSGDPSRCGAGLKITVWDLPLSYSPS